MREDIAIETRVVQLWGCLLCAIVVIAVLVDIVYLTAR